MQSTPFRRDAFTWLAYLMLAYFAYLQSSLGPLRSFLAAELDIDYTISGLYSAAFAIGMTAAGFTADRLAARLGRRALFWGGGAGMLTGALLLTLGRTPPLTIAATFGMAYLGSLTLIMIQATLSDHHGPNRAIALTESNTLAVVGGTLAAVVVSLGEEQGLTWRLVAYLGGVAWLLLAFRFWRVPIPERRADAPAQSPSRGPAGRLPRAFWGFWLVVFFATAVEACLVFWSSGFLEQALRFRPEDAALLMSLFGLGMIVGRAAGSVLTRRYPTITLLLIAGGIVLVSFPLLWLARWTPLNILGLFLCGLGIANLFPLTLAAASTVGINNPNAASARTSMGSGVAAAITPFTLGVLADQVGIESAFGVLLPLAVIVVVVTLYARHLARA
jgi:predicted MFS family arabinose efflux permease